MIRIAETWDEFTGRCPYRFKGNEYSNVCGCNHQKRNIENCLEQRYCPRVEHIIKKEPQILPLWKQNSTEGHQEYAKIVYEGFDQILKNKTLIDELEGVFVGYDIPASIKGCRAYWLSQEGRKNKTSRPGEVDWVQTVRKTIRFNLVRPVNSFAKQSRPVEQSPAPYHKEWTGGSNG